MYFVASAALYAGIEATLLELAKKYDGPTRAAV
jgi:hypothetical protein